MYAATTNDKVWMGYGLNIYVFFSFTEWIKAYNFACAGGLVDLAQLNADMLAFNGGEFSF